MQYLSWSGTFSSISWGDQGTPGDPPIKVLNGQASGITNRATWGDSLDVYTISGTSDADLIFLDLKDRETPLLVNVKQINGGAGSDLIDLTSTRFKNGAVTLNGGSGSDWLLGNAGSDRLFGSHGSDWLKGYGGNDYLSGGNNNDRLYGGRGNDKLIGGAGNDYLSGQFGKDILTGGSGYDRFVFDVSPTKANRDTITDFSVKYDSIQLDSLVFTKAGSKGGLKAKAFWSGSMAHDANDRVIYNKETGHLSYDPDGTGQTPQKLLAQLSKGLAMTHKDFFII